MVGSPPGRPYRRINTLDRERHICYAHGRLRMYIPRRVFWDTSTVGQSVAYSAAVSPVPTSGTVSFTDNQVPVPGCQGVSLAGGQASCTVTYQAAGVHSIIAVYSGTSTFAGSWSPSLSQVVTATACATLAGCNLHGLNLTSANLTGANLTGANLTGANLTGVQTTGANFNKVTRSNTTCPNGINSTTYGRTCIGHP